MKRLNKLQLSWFALPFDINSNNLECLKTGKITSFIWSYGTAIEIPISINDNFINIPLQINTYDVNRSPVVELNYQSADDEGLIYFRINTELSLEYFKPGLYYCEVVAKRDTAYDEPVNTTLLPMNACTFLVV